MSKPFTIDEGLMSLQEVLDFSFDRRCFSSIEIAPASRERVVASHRQLQALLERRVPIYGVTTGFGDSCFRVIDSGQSETLQNNLISYLLCGTGKELSLEASRATFLVRLKSLARGFSGVSLELLTRMTLFLERGWIPVIPREGSLGASGDLIPLAYLARVLQGEGALYVEGEIREASEVLRQAGVPSYTLKPKEGLALVNGTSAMAGLCLINWNSARFLAETAALSSAWLCLALRGRTEAFGTLVNNFAKTHPGQKQAAQWIRSLLEEEDYRPRPIDQIQTRAGLTEEFVQDRYSLRCAPQILGPVIETLGQLEGWLQTEINGTSDNPLVDEHGELAMGGNFYGGYLGQGMDYLKICMAHLADMLDRQLTMLIDDKCNRGLPANLANWEGLPESERFLHHGLKGLHQAVNALTSEVMAKAMPNGIFSRSSESHNQDKVSLGMSAAVQCHEQLEQLYTIQAMVLICLTQALDLRGTALQGTTSLALYESLRRAAPFVTHDMPLGSRVQAVREWMKTTAAKTGRVLINDKKYNDEKYNDEK